jgi:hypothetical protein
VTVIAKTGESGVSGVAKTRKSGVSCVAKTSKSAVSCVRKSRVAGNNSWCSVSGNYGNSVMGGYGSDTNSWYKSGSVTIVNSSDNSSLSETMSNLTNGVGISFRISLSLSQVVTVVAKTGESGVANTSESRVSCVAKTSKSSVSCVRKSSVAGYNSWGSMSGNYGNSMSGGYGNSVMGGYGSDANSGNKSRSVTIVNTGDNSSLSLAKGNLKRSVGLGIRVSHNSGNGQADNGKGSHCDEVQNAEQS